MFSSVRARRTWVLNDLFVEAEFRRGGVAGSLMQVAEDFAKENDGALIALETGESNKQAQKLYESRGWELEQGVRHYSLTL